MLWTLSSHFSHTFCKQQRLDLNPQCCDNDAIVLPLCYYCVSCCRFFFSIGPAWAGQQPALKLYNIDSWKNYREQFKTGSYSHNFIQTCYNNYFCRDPIPTKIHYKKHYYFPGANVFKLYFAIFLSPCACSIVGLEPSMLGWWCDCSTIVLLLYFML